MMAYDTNTTRNGAGPRPDALSTGIPFWDMMLSFGKASQGALHSYAPQAAQSARGAVQQATSSVEVIPVGEETLNVGTRVIAGETTRVRRVVVETPVEQSVSLREERVIVERRKPTGAAATATQAILAETVIEMSDSFEVAEVWKSVRVTEEVVLRREVTNRLETVRDTVRRDEVIVEQATLPAPRLQAEAAPRDHKPAAPVQAGKPEAANPQAVGGHPETKPAQRPEPLAAPHERLGAAAASTMPNQGPTAQPVGSLPKPAANLAKVMADLPKPATHPTDAERNDKGANSRKG